MSIGISFIFFGSNTSQNFAVPLYGSTGALAFGLMYLTATVFSFFAPSVISRFPSVRRALAFFSFEFCIFVGVFAFNIPVLILICSVIHGCFLSCFWASQGVYLGQVSDTSNRGKRTGTFWAIFMAGNICGNICAFLVLKFIGVHPVTSIWNGAISIMYLLLSLFALLGSIILCVLPPSLPELSAASDKEALLPQSSESVGILEGMKNCYYLLTTPKFLLLFFTLFSNGYIALFVPTQMNRQVHDNVIVGIFMSLYACSEIVFSKMGAYISDRYGAYYVIIMGSISQIIGQCLMMVNDSSQRVWVYCIAYLFHGGADACFQTQALALTLYYFPGLSATANSCFRLIQFVSGAVCSITTPLYLKDGVVEWGGFLMENGVMAALLALSFVCLTVFVVRYKKEIEVDDRLLTARRVKCVVC